MQDKDLLLQPSQERKKQAQWYRLTLMLLVANLANTKRYKKKRKITETLANGYSSESTRRELSNEYQDDRVSMVFQESCMLVLWTKIVSALEGLRKSGVQ